MPDLKHNCWFERKPQGWGWIPVTWQGWAIIWGYVAVAAVVFAVPRLLSFGPISPALQWLIVAGAGLVVIAVCRKKSAPYTFREVTSLGLGDKQGEPGEKV